MLVIRVHGLGIYPPFQAGLQHNDTTCKHCREMVCNLNNYFCQCFDYVSAEDPSVFLSVPQAHPAPVSEGTCPLTTLHSFTSSGKETQLQGTRTFFWTGLSSKHTFELSHFSAQMCPKETWSTSLPLTSPPEREFGLACSSKMSDRQILIPWADVIWHPGADWHFVG